MLKDVNGNTQTYEWHRNRAKQGLYHPNDKREKAQDKKASTAPITKSAGKKKMVRYETINLLDGEWQTETFHAPARERGQETHKPTKLKGGGCQCDVCRYTRLGHGALLMPGDLKEAAEYSKAMNAIEDSAVLLAADRDKQAVTEEHLADGRSVQILLSNGKTVESRVSDQFAWAPEGVGNFNWEISEDTEWQWDPEQKLWVYIGALHQDDWKIRLNLAASGMRGINTLAMTEGK